MRYRIELVLPLALAAGVTGATAQQVKTGAPAKQDSVKCAMPAGGDHAAHLKVMQQCAAASNQGKAGDTAFASLQARGRIGMGVDQYTSTHRFDDLDDGGRIELQQDSASVEGVKTIRAHLRGIAAAFANGDFTTPAFVHMKDVPGAAVMARRRASITYRFRELPRGGEVRITTGDGEALHAIHSFLAFQRAEHNAAGSHKH